MLFKKEVRLEFRKQMHRVDFVVLHLLCILIKLGYRKIVASFSTKCCLRRLRPNATVMDQSQIFLSPTIFTWRLTKSVPYSPYSSYGIFTTVLQQRFA